MWEAEQGYADLNGDGDVEDFVLHHVSLTGGAVTNLGLAVAYPYNVELPGRRLVFTADEFGQEVDLNGDGDARDYVAFSYDPATATLTNSGLAVRRGSVSNFDGIALFPASEPGQRADLNGDGDVSDYLQYAWEEGAAPRSLGLEGEEIPLSEDSIHFYFKVQEAAGTDLNGDGDSLDRVLQVFDRSSGIVTNLRLAVTEMLPSKDAVAFLVPESGQGRDLNGDGDESDLVVHAHAPDLGTVDLGLAVGSFCIPPYGPCSNHLLFKGEWIVMNVGEAEQGGTDLDGDGDTDDVVLFAHRRGTTTSTNLGISHDLLNSASSGYVPFERHESWTGDDLNGDGDASDTVIFLRRYDEPAPLNTGLAGGSGGALDRDWLALGVSEAAQGAKDMNGDGDTHDAVLHLVNSLTGETRNLGLAAASTPLFSMSGGRLIFGVSESDQGGTDLNGDGDALDSVCFYYDATWDFLVDTRAEGNFIYLENGRARAFTVTEAGRDLNGDGDTLDVLIRVLVIGQRYR